MNNKIPPRVAQIEKVEGTSYIVIPMENDTNNPNSFGYSRIRGRLSGPEVSSVLCQYQPAEKRAFGLFSGETEGIPDRNPIFVSGTRKETQNRLKSHMEYIAQTLADES